MTLSHLWHPWPARNWPFLSREEDIFVQRLRSFGAPQPEKLERGDYSILLNALRSGLDYDTLAIYLPGVKPSVLLAAYEDLELRRWRVVNAWEEVQKASTLDSFIEGSAACASLLSLAISRILPHATKATDRGLSISLEAVSAEMIKVSEDSQRVEKELSAIEQPSELGVMLGRRLYDPYNPGIWGNPFFVPPRVGTLTPVRVRALLGESIK